MKNDQDFKIFLNKHAEQIRQMRQLDPGSSIVYGASAHDYAIQKPVADADILEYKRKNKIELPLSYRTYLQYFGDCGASEFNGTLSFEKKIVKCDVSRPSQLSKVDDVHDYKDEHPIKNENGRVAITHGLNPGIVYLVLNGDAAGYVCWWDHFGCVARFNGTFGASLKLSPASLATASFCANFQ